MPTPHSQNQAFLVPVASVPRSEAAIPAGTIGVSFQPVGGKKEKCMVLPFQGVCWKSHKLFHFSLFGQNLVTWPRLPGEEAGREDSSFQWHDLVENWGILLQKKGRVETGERPTESVLLPSRV